MHNTSFVQASLAHEASAAYQRGHREQLEKEHTRLMREKQQLEQRHKELVDNLRRNREGEHSPDVHSQAIWWGLGLSGRSGLD